MIALMAWISSQTGMVFDETKLPEVKFTSSERMAILAYGEEEYRKMGKDQTFTFNALYNHETRTVYLRKNWNIKNPYHQGELLHELVHYMQIKNGGLEKVQCVGNLEPQAYFLHEFWLRLNKLAIDPEVFDPFSIAIRSMCPDQWGAE